MREQNTFVVEHSSLKGRIFLLFAGIVIFSQLLLTLSSENISAEVFSGSPVVLPPGLNIEEYPLRGKPKCYAERAVFEPLRGSEKEILAKHREERDKPSEINSSYRSVHLGKDVLAVKEVYENNEKISVKLSQNGELIFATPLGDQSPVDPIQGLWSFQTHWVLEVAHCRKRKVEEGPYTSVYFDWNGEIIQDGKSLSKQHGYQETFGFQLMNSKSFYFLKKGGKIGISYDGKQVLLGYSEVPHYHCCEPSVLNPKVFQNMVSFFARRGSNWYYVEIGVFKNE